MSGAELAGRLREQVTLLRQAGARDAAGGAAGAWEEIGRTWAAVAIEGEQATAQGEARSALPLWRVTLRPCGIAVGDRIVRAAGTMLIRVVRRDPALPDRVVAIGEELR